MIDTSPRPEPTIDVATWNRQQQEYTSRFQELLPANKTALFDALAAAGIKRVTVVFDGCGDSGQIEKIDAITEETNVALPSGQIEIAHSVWSSPEVARRTMTIQETLEAFVFEFLAQTHGGWDNGEGAYGDFTFDVSDRTITLEYDERYTETHYFQHSF